MLSRVTSALLLFAFLVAPLAAQDGASAQVRQLEEKWTAAYKDRQIDILSSLLTEDFMITVEDGNTYSKAGYITCSSERRRRK